MNISVRQGTDDVRQQSKGTHLTSRCSKDVYWFDLSCFSSLSISLLFTHFDTGSSCLRPLPSLTHWRAICRRQRCFLFSAICVLRTWIKGVQHHVTVFPVCGGDCTQDWVRMCLSIFFFPCWQRTHSHISSMPVCDKGQGFTVVSLSSYQCPQGEKHARLCPGISITFAPFSLCLQGLSSSPVFLFLSCVVAATQTRDAVALSYLITPPLTLRCFHSQTRTHVHAHVFFLLISLKRLIFTDILTWPVIVADYEKNSREHILKTKSPQLVLCCHCFCWGVANLHRLLFWSACLLVVLLLLWSMRMLLVLKSFALYVCLPPKYLPLRDQTSALASRGVASCHTLIYVSRLKVKLNTAGHTNSVVIPTGSTYSLTFSISLVVNLHFTSLPKLGCDHFLHLHPLPLLIKLTQ